jgi:hypothetical protein
VAASSLPLLVWQQGSERGGKSSLIEIVPARSDIVSLQEACGVDDCRLFLLYGPGVSHLAAHRAADRG